MTTLQRGIIISKAMNKLKDRLKRALQEIVSRPIHFFVALTLIGGLGFIAVVPPFQIPDEFVHFTRAYEVSEFKSAHRYHYRQVDFKGSDLPSSILATQKDTRLYLPKGQPDVIQAKKYDLIQTQKSFDIDLNKPKLGFYDTGAVPAYFPLLYAPQAMIIKILSLFNSPVIVMLYATRLVGLGIWLGLAVLALKLIRPTRLRLAMASVLLLPMFVAQASASTDPLLNGLLVLYIALISNQLFKKEVLTHKRLLLFAALLFLMTMGKPNYLVFGLLVLLLPTLQQKLRGFIYKSLALILPFILYGVWSMLTKDTGPPIYIDSVAIGHAVPSAQVSYLVPNIFNFAQPLLNTVLLGWGDPIYTSIIGNFGKLDTPLPLVFVIVGYVAMLIAIFAHADNHSDTKEGKQFFSQRHLAPLVILSATIFTISIYLAMYIYSTPPAAKIVTGVQGRYFLPLIPLLVLFISKDRLILKKSFYETILISAPTLLVIVSLIVVFLRFWVTYP